MKNIFFLCLAFGLMSILSCKQPKAPVATPTSANVTIHINHKINGVNLIQDSLMYTNASGNLFSVHLFRYYLSNMILIKDDGTDYKLANYDLIDAFDANFSKAFALNVPNGTYTSMKFMLGVDSVRNHTGVQEGDLDPANNMFWSWSTGYIFFKHEGYYKDTANNQQSLLFHLGSDNGLASIQMPISLIVDGADKLMSINFDISKMYNSPLIDFNTDYYHMSTSPGDSTWMTKMIANTNDAFTFEQVQ